MSKFRVDQLEDLAGTKTVNVVNIATTSQLVASSITSTPVGTITATDVQTALSQVNTQLAAKQPLDATLTALAGLATGANQLAYSTGTDTFAQTSLTPFARTILDDNDAATVRATIGVTALTLGTMQNTTSGTAFDFTGIPATTKRICINFGSVSTNGSSPVQLLMGTSSGFETTNYLGCINQTAASAMANTQLTTSILTDSIGGAAFIRHGRIVFELIGANTWSFDGAISNSEATRLTKITGSKGLAGTLDRIRINTVNGTDLFDLGILNIIYEG